MKRTGCEKCYVVVLLDILASVCYDISGNGNLGRCMQPLTDDGHVVDGKASTKGQVGPLEYVNICMW